MPAHPRVIGYLLRAVSHEFGAAQQFTLQAAQAEALGLASLAAALRADAAEELRHAGAFLQRLHRLGVVPPAGPVSPRPVGRTQAELLRFGLVTEAEAMRLYDEAGRYCERIADDGGRELFATIREDEVRHHRDLEQRLRTLGGGT